MSQLQDEQGWSSELEDVLRARLQEVTADASIPPELQQAALTGGRSRLSRRRFLRVAVTAGVSSLVVTAVALSREEDQRPATGSRLFLTPAVLEFSTMSEPVRSAAEWLNVIAARAAALPSTEPSGRYAYVRTQTWDLSTSVSDGLASSRVEPQRREQWIANDGSGRLKITRVGPGGSLEPISDEVYSGGLSLFWPIGSLPSDRVAMDQALSVGHPDDNGPAERFVAVCDAYKQMPIDARARGAMLSVLAQTPGLTLSGSVADRLGRPGVGVSVDSDYSGLPTRYTLIFEPTDGRLLGFEEMLTTSAGKLNVKVPAVIGYTIFDDAAMRESTN